MNCLHGSSWLRQPRGQKFLPLLLGLSLVLPCWLPGGGGWQLRAEEAGQTGQSYYVDSVGGDDSRSGQSESEAWRSLEMLNRRTFGPGDHIYLKRGSVFLGQLWPKGSGEEARPIVMTSYGEGAKPQLRGEGQVQEALRLYNQSYWEISDLDISNWGANPEPRRALWVENQDAGRLSHIYLRDLDIHDVNGRVSDRYYEDGGIICMVTGGARPSYFDDLLIENNRIWHVDYDGIFIRNQWMNRGSRVDGIGPWTPNTRVVVRGNDLRDIGGDGAVVCECQSPLVEHNYAQDCHIRATKTWSAGLWCINSDDALFQYNEVCFTRGDLDGQAFDCDGLCNRTVYQYNYSHDNEGGFMLICNWSNPKKDFNDRGIIRYNISQNDRSKLFHFSGINTNFEVYNNTIYVGPGNEASFSRENGVAGSSVHFRNNLFINEGENFAYVYRETDCDFSHNAYIGRHPKSEPPDAAGFRAEPGLLDPGRAGRGLAAPLGYRPLSTSALAGAGELIEDNGGLDYSGRSLEGVQPFIGALRPLDAQEEAQAQASLATSWSAQEAFGQGMGADGWTYALAHGQNTQMCYWNGDKERWGLRTDYAGLGADWAHPCGEEEAQRVFRVPRTGRYHLSAEIQKRNLGGGDGCRAEIRSQREGSLASWDIPAQSAEPLSYGRDYVLEAGDFLIFAVSAGKNDHYDLVSWNPQIRFLGPVQDFHVEGEAGQFSGQARPQDWAPASEGQVAGFIGAGAENRVSYQLEVPEDGLYMLNLEVFSKEQRLLYCQVNEQAPRVLAVSSPSWEEVQRISYGYVPLKAGVNRLLFYNDQRPAPSIDRLTLLGP